MPRAVVHRPVVLLALLVVLGSCATASPAPPRPPGTVTVMTWNVETITHDPREWAPVIAAEHPDLVGLQEICVREAFELADLLRREHGLQYAVAPGPIRPPTPGEAHAPVNARLGPVCGTSPDAVEFGLAVLSRVPVSAPEVTTYPPDHRDEQRGYLTVRTASGVIVVDTHLGLAGVATDQVRHLADAVPPGPAVVLGDLNVPIGAPELAPLWRSFTEVDPAGRYPTMDRKVDDIFVRDVAVVGGPRTPAVTSSDHRPLVSELRTGD